MNNEKAREKLIRWEQDDCYTWDKLYWWVDQMTKLSQYKHITPEIIQRIIADGLAKY